MTTWICCACGTQYPPADNPPGSCPICDDPRQYVPHDKGQRWVSWAEFLDGHRADIHDDHGLLGIGCAPRFGIGQRALLVKGVDGNVLWDCITYLDDEIAERIAAEGRVGAIAISHPHYYSAMIEWAHRFECPIYLHAGDERHGVRSDPTIRFWDGGTHELGDGLTLIHCGGHYAGAQVLHLRDRRALLSGDIVQVIPDRRFVTFMYSYPNMIPLPPSRVRAIAAALEPFEFDTIHGAWFDTFVPEDADGAVRRSAERYVRAVTEPGLSS